MASTGEAGHVFEAGGQFDDPSHAAGSVVRQDRTANVNSQVGEKGD
jgi:hypothetical protein